MTVRGCQTDVFPANSRETAASLVHEVASRVAWELFAEWHDDPGSEREGAWALDLFAVLNDERGLDAVRQVTWERQGPDCQSTK